MVDVPRPATTVAPRVSRMDMRRSAFERLIAEHYESVKHEVLTTVARKLAAHNLHPDASDLEAAYNAAWHALYQRSLKNPQPVEKLGGWLATVAYRRTVDDIRSAQLKHRAVADNATSAAVENAGYEPDVDDYIDSRRKYRQWLLSVRMRLNAREQQAVGLCILHEHSRKDASEIMGVDIKRLDKIMIAANKKLGGTLEAINRGEWCQDHRSLVKAYAFGLHEVGGERHTLALQHLMECQACASYVRSVRGLAGVMPAPALAAGALGAAGGTLAGLSGLLKSGAGGGAAAGGAGTAAGGGGATLLGGIAAKTAAVCASAACAAGSAIVVIERAPRPVPKPMKAAATERHATPAVSATVQPPTASPRQPAARSTAIPRRRPPRRAKKTIAPEPKSQEAQEIAELGIEPQATAASTPTPTPRHAPPATVSPPTAVTASEFDFEGG